MDFNFDTGTISSVLELDPGSSNISVLGTSGVVLPTGTTAQRVASTGVLRYNTDIAGFEGFDGVLWSPVQLTNDNLSSLSELNGVGFVVQTGPGTFEERTISGTTDNITVENGTGELGDITIDLATAGTAGTYVSVTTDAYGRVTAGTTTQAWSTLTDTPTTLTGYGITDAILASGDAVSLGSGLLADLPTVGTTGAFYFASDTNELYYDNGTDWVVNIPAFTGDATSVAGETELTLATVNTNVGAFGSSSAVGTFTVNAKGLITAAADVTITPAAIGAINVDQLGVASGVATLDVDGKLTVSQIPEALVGALQYQGVWDADTNTPTIVNGTGITGQYYKVNVAGNTNIDGTASWQLGDMIVFNGTTWDGIDSVASEVTSVFGRIGAVTATLASADFADQGTTTTFLKGNADGNPSWSAVSLTTDVTGVLQAGQFPELTGDITTVEGSLATTLATVNTDVGSYGSVTAIPVITVNAKGLITAVTTAAISSDITITGDATGTGTTGADTEITLATVNTNVGTFGDSNTVAQVTVNAKGLVTAVTEVDVTPSAIGAVENAGATPSIQSDTFANIPAATTVGAVFIATDTHAIYRADGTVWVQIGESSVLYTENVSSPVDSTVTGANAVSIGSGNTVSAENAIVTGADASTAVYGANVHANGSFTNPGDAQSGKYVLRNITTDATETEVFLDGAAARIVLPNNSAVAYSAQIVARRTDASGSEGAFKLEGLISRDATAASTTLVGSRSRTILTRPSTDWSAEVFADTTNGALTFKVTGPVDTTIRWVVVVTTSEVLN